MSAGSPRLFRHTWAPDNSSPSRLEGIHVGVLKCGESVKFAGESSGEMLLTRLLMGRMDLWCLPVLSEMPLFTRSAHVNEPNREVMLHLGEMGH